MKHTLSIAFLACFGLSACQQYTDSPSQVAEKYWHALKSGDFTSAKGLVTKETRTNIDNYFALPDDKKIALDSIKLSNEMAIVHTTITNHPATTNQSQNSNQINFDTILILEDGEWKIDAARTHLPTLKQANKPSNGNQLSDALQKNLDSMDEAIEQGSDMLNNFLQQGSKEMSDSLLKGMNEMNKSLRDAIDKMKQRRNQEDSVQPPTNNNGEGLI